MSGISTSLTFTVPAGSWSSDPGPIEVTGDEPELELSSDTPCFHATCRNGHLERFLSAMVDEYQLHGLDYLGKGSVLLDETLITRAAKDLEQILSIAESGPAEFIGRIEEHYGEIRGADLLSPSLQVRARSLSAAIAAFDEARRGDEGDDMATYIAFLNTHLCVLRDALDTKRHVVYVLWPY